MNNGAILLAGGSSRRMGGQTDDKVLLTLGDQPLFLYSLNTFLKSNLCQEIVIVHRDEEQKEQLQSLLPKDSSVQFMFTLGGEERMNSVHNGLKAFTSPPNIVFIHDAARPFISVDLLQKLEQSTEAHGAACPATKVTDTLKRTTTDQPSKLASVDRKNLWAMQTPQTFVYSEILHAYQDTIESGAQITDDTSALERKGGKIYILENPSPNPKLTTPADLPMMEFLLKT